MIELQLVPINNPAHYRIVDQAHTLPKNRKAGLPYDRACQASAGHHTRFDNLNKSRLDGTKKNLIDARKDVIAQAIKLYRQQAAPSGSSNP